MRSIKARADRCQAARDWGQDRSGKDVLSACREAGTTDKSYYRGRQEYGGMKVDQAKRLK